MARMVPSRLPMMTEGCQRNVENQASSTVYQTFKLAPGESWENTQGQYSGARG